MKRIYNNIIIITVVLALGLVIGCEKLEVENLNQPDIATVLDSPDDVRTAVQSAFLAMWESMKLYTVNMPAVVAANHTTASWGNFAWRDVGEEPRTPWNNDPSYSEADMTETPYYGFYATISQVNDALFLLNVEDMEIGPGGRDNDMVLASSYLIRGISLGQLGVAFDQAMIPMEESDLALLEFQPWSEVIEAGIADLERAIEIAGSAAPFSWPGATMPGLTIDNDYVVQLANSYAARFLAHGSRTKEQNDNDISWSSYGWGDVLSFAQNGLTSDFAPVGDGLPWEGGTWWDLNIKYLRNPGWGRIHTRVIHLMDPAHWLRYPTNDIGLPLPVDDPNFNNPHGPDEDPGKAYSDDARLLTDFEYLPSNDFPADRGGWFYSHYRQSRYDYPPSTSDEGYHMGESLGPLREFRVYDVQLLVAEAMARTGNVGGAVSILNDPANERKARGGLDDVETTDLEEVLDIIFYERDIELANNGWMIHFGDMRRRDKLQQGTPLHFPVPGAELEALEIPIYTFGGYNNADGVNTSDGGDWIRPYYHWL